MWIVSHKLYAALVFILVILAIEFISLPLANLETLRKINPNISALMLQRINETEIDEFS